MAKPKPEQVKAPARPGDTVKPRPIRTMNDRMAAALYFNRKRHRANWTAAQP